jgi:hypothetical protein
MSRETQPITAIVYWCLYKTYRTFKLSTSFIIIFLKHMLSALKRDIYSQAWVTSDPWINHAALHNKMLKTRSHKNKVMLEQRKIVKVKCHNSEQRHKLLNNAFFLLFWKWINSSSLLHIFFTLQGYFFSSQSNSLHAS